MDPKRLQSLLKDGREIHLQLDYITRFLNSLGSQLRDEKVAAHRLFEHFLSTDLNADKALQKTIETNIQQIHNEKVRGVHTLQLDILVNISESFEHRNADNFNRMLKISATDGFQRVYAIEYRRIPHLSFSSPHGVKIQISDVLVRRGMILLTNENVRVLGGAVPEDESNSAVEEPAIQGDGPSISNHMEEEEPPAPMPPIRRTLPSNNAISNRTGPMSSSLPSDNNFSGAGVKKESREAARQNAIVLDEEEDGLDEQPLTRKKTKPAVIYDDDYESSSMPLLDDSLDESVLLAAERPFQYLAEVLPKSDSYADKTIRIKGFIAGTKPPFGFQGRYSLKVRIEDGTEAIVASLAEDIIEKLVGCSCGDFQKFYTSDKKKSQSLLAQMEAGLASTEGIFSLKFAKEGEFPVVIRIEAPSRQDLRMLVHATSS
eukprot:TRINITY_DN5978_c0_g2_i2.p1 TRINITY_DN5978_c0_g2~~TRINITY_DN5978_c0_g2_i2.p1  ORF type:complete len:431 (+),score=92.71 TRINITY_DN5978_c0_g2_i2:110-1402(+)